MNRFMNELIIKYPELAVCATEVTPQELINTLDDRNYALAMQAIRFRRYGCHIENLLDMEMDMEADIEIDVETDMNMENDFEQDVLYANQSGGL